MAFPHPVLEEMFSSGVVREGDGTPHTLNSQIPFPYAAALYRAVKETKPRLCIEVGMAYGVSSLAILGALHELGHGSLISVDPHQSTDWKGLGVASVERAGYAGRHTLVEQYDYLALPELLQSGTAVQFAYIDGWHTFDYVLVDFFYIDKMLSEGGVVGFNDCGYRAIHRVLRFVRSHRKYREVDVGLPRNYKGRNMVSSAVRRVAKRSNSDVFLRKLEQSEPAWNYYARF